jgi:hypothetical protein
MITCAYRCNSWHTASYQDYDICESCEAKEAGKGGHLYLKIRHPDDAPSAIICVLKGGDPSAGYELLAASHPARRSAPARRPATAAASPARTTTSPTVAATDTAEEHDDNDSSRTRYSLNDDNGEMDVVVAANETNSSSSSSSDISVTVRPTLEQTAAAVAAAAEATAEAVVRSVTSSSDSSSSLSLSPSFTYESFSASSISALPLEESLEALPAVDTTGATSAACGEPDATGVAVTTDAGTAATADAATGGLTDSTSTLDDSAQQPAASPTTAATTTNNTTTSLLTTSIVNLGSSLSNLKGTVAAAATPVATDADVASITTTPAAPVPVQPVTGTLMARYLEVRVLL